MHAWSTRMLIKKHYFCYIHLYSARSRNEDADKTAEVGGHALNSHGNYIVDHGKIMELFFCISVEILRVPECHSKVIQWW